MITDLNNTFAEPQSRWGWCQNIANQYGDFKIMKSWFERGEARFAKWRTVIDCSHSDDNYKNEFSHRQILPFEICLDMDEVEKLPQAYELFERFMEDGILDEVYLFETGSKGIHIHIFLIKEYIATMPDKKAWREKLARAHTMLFHGFDTQKESRNVPIALEFAPHWKSGKQKRLVNGRGEFYGQNRILK